MDILSYISIMLVSPNIISLTSEYGDLGFSKSNTVLPKFNFILSFFKNEED